MKIKVHFWLFLCLAFFASYSLAFSNSSGQIGLDTLNLPEDIYTQTNQCNSKLSLCLDDIANPSDLSIKINDIPYTGNIKYCEEDTIYIYTMFTLYGFGKIGPYYLDNWEVNGQKFSGQFQDVDELIILMNQWDPNGNWIYDPNTF
jgi:hypothetical protein